MAAQIGRNVPAARILAVLSDEQITVRRHAGDGDGDGGTFRTEENDRIVERRAFEFVYGDRGRRACGREGIAIVGRSKCPIMMTLVL